MTNDTTVSGATTDDVSFPHVTGTPKAKRAKGIDQKTFAKTYTDMAKAGNTSKEIADKLGMNEASVISRASTLRKFLKGAGFELPYPKTERGQGAAKTALSADKLKAFLEGLDGSDNL